jgi:hypothetical protein
MLLALLFAVPGLLVAVVYWDRHTRTDWILALSLLAYYPVIRAYGAMAYANRTLWYEGATLIGLGLLLVHSAAAIWLSKSRVLVASVTPLAIYLGVIAVLITEITINK